MSYERPDWWYENSDAYEEAKYYASEFTPEQEILSDVRESFAIVLQELYTKGPLDKSRLEKALDDISYHLQLPLKAGDLEIERKGKREEIRMQAALEAWKSFAKLDANFNQNIA